MKWKLPVRPLLGSSCRSVQSARTWHWKPVWEKFITNPRKCVILLEHKTNMCRNKQMMEWAWECSPGVAECAPPVADDTPPVYRWHRSAWNCQPAMNRPYPAPNSKDFPIQCLLWLLLACFEGTKRSKVSESDGNGNTLLWMRPFWGLMCCVHRSLPNDKPIVHSLSSSESGLNVCLQTLHEHLP